MKTIEEIKTELNIKMSQRDLESHDIEKLPKNDELRTFICQFKAIYACWYALHVDEKPTKETRAAACKYPMEAYWYARYVDEKPTKETRTAACKDPRGEEYYQNWEKEKEIKISISCQWGENAIGINIEKPNKRGYEKAKIEALITIEEAKRLSQQLQETISLYEDIEADRESWEKELCFEEADKAI